jgi:hypothetical protein
MEAVPRDEWVKLANIAARIAADADPCEDYCTSFLFPRSLFEGEVIKALEVVLGIRRATMRGELLRIDIDIDDSSAAGSYMRNILRPLMVERVECFGGILQDTSEGFVILSRDLGAVENRHGASSILARIMHDAERFRISDRGSRAGDPSVWRGVRQLAVQHVWD